MTSLCLENTLRPLQNTTYLLLFHLLVPSLYWISWSQAVMKETADQQPFQDTEYGPQELRPGRSRPEGHGAEWLTEILLIPSKYPLLLGQPFEAVKKSTTPHLVK